MAFENVIDVMHRQIGEALREDAFKEIFLGVGRDDREKVVQEHLRRRGVHVTVIAVVQANVPDGEYQLEWQSDAGGKERQFFSPSER